MTDLREGYNKPPETPREEMWAAIQSRLGVPGSAEEAGGQGIAGKVLSLTDARRTRYAHLRKPLGWAGAAAALLVLGLGIGRLTAPVGPGGIPGPMAEAPSTETAARNPEILRVASLAHLSRTESLLTLVRADGRTGRLEPTVGSWARGLLTQTRLLMDAQTESDPVMAELMEDLELVLMQILGAANATQGDQGQVRSELNLALDGIEDFEVLPRIQAVLPAGARFVGT